MFNLSATGRIASLVALSLALAAPAHAVTVLLGGPTANVASVTRSSGNLTLQVTAHKFAVAPNSLTSLSQLTGSGLVSVASVGLGVAGGANSQLDTNTASARESLLISSDKAFSLSGLKLTSADSNDTLQIYGVGNDGTLTSLGFDGNIRSGLAGAASFVNSAGDTTALTFLTETAFYKSFLFTTRVGGDVVYGGGRGQGYLIQSLTADAVPEPATWAMLITGFGLVGAAARRRRAIAA